jgi:hypothetical protein
MELIRSQHPEYLENGRVLAKPYLEGGVRLERGQLGAMEAGNYAPIFKNGEKLILRKPTTVYVFE